MKLGHLVELTQLSDMESERFHRLRNQAFETAWETYEDRAASYNVSHEPYREMPFGIVSLVSELQKRIIRLTSLVSPRREEELREEDLDRILDTMIDSINYASWGYAMMKIALAERNTDGNERPDPL